MTTKKDVKAQIVLLSLGQLNAAQELAGVLTSADKASASQAVTDLIWSGALGLDQVLRIRASVAKPVGAVVDDALRQQVNAISATAQGAATQVESALAVIGRTSTDVGTALTQLRSDFSKLSAKLETRVAAISKPDEAHIQASLANLFDQFRTEVTPEKLTQVANAVGAFKLTRAGDIFPVTAYGDVDFSDLLVGVWDDPQAPQLVDDYVFNPSHLHQSLIALDDVLPDNIWLAGERGTGKTEFVTQLAARLKRKLFRVNFDEALERADFIGGNTIENSSVVWKAGIITQAIQHAGSIILLDEIGFARAQSVSILHSLCERSPHRAIAIAETGERIQVASHVVFFGADNSNGHGDTSGNFAGVREQNSAFLDRFSFTLRFEYLSAADECNLIINRTALPLDAAISIVQFANVAREKARAGLLTQPPSLRQLFAWARAVKKGLPVEQAFVNAIINKFPADCEPELRGVFNAQIDIAAFKQSLGGV
jgi:MoxR-like ATPase